MGQRDEQMCLLDKTTWLSRQAPQSSTYLAEFATLQDPNLNFVFSPKICKIITLHTTEMHAYVNQKTHIGMFIATLFVIVPNRKYSKYPSTVEWINKI